MRVFVTGATGFIGSRIVPQLIGAGHQVLGMTRSEKGAEALRAQGAEAHHARLEDLDSIRKGAEGVEGIIHCAFDHDDFSKIFEKVEQDRAVITAMAEVLAGSQRPLVITSGVGLGLSEPGKPATEDHFDANHPNPRKASEEAGNAALQHGVNVSVVRLPQVHDTHKQGLITPYVQLVREKGVVGYVGEGANRYSAAPVDAVAQLYRLVVERAEAGSRWNAVQEEGVRMKDIAETIAGVLKLESESLTLEEAGATYGWLGNILSWDLPASSAYTQKTLGWDPSGPTLLQDLRQGKF